jgi:hypothetical protein
MRYIIFVNRLTGQIYEVVKIGADVLRITYRCYETDEMYSYETAIGEFPNILEYVGEL